MIRFSHPLVLLALPVLLALFATALRRGRVQLLRLLCLALLLTALAEPRLPVREEENTLLFLVDRSPSVGLTAAPEEIEALLRRLAAGLDGWTIGVAQFAAQAEVVSPLSSEPPHIQLDETLGSDTRLGPALALSLALLPQDGVGQIVLVSDGRFSDSAQLSISEAQRRRIPISALPVGRQPANDLSLIRFDAPSDVAVGRRFEMEIESRATTEQPARLAIYRNGDLVSQTDLIVPPRGAAYLVQDTLRDVDVHHYEAVLRGTGDPIPENDRLSAVVRSTDLPTVLLVDGGVETAIPSLLDALGISHSRLAKLPGLEALGPYRQLILTGVSLGDLTESEIAALEDFVRTFGGGLLVVEGRTEAEGFRGGGIERILPISYTVPEKGQEASLAIVFLLDRSSSMRARAGGALKIDILKESAASSVGLLTPETLVGILAFNREQEWLVPIAPLGDVEAAYDALRPLSALGGTDIYYALVEALDRLEPTEARSKHILLISDGITTNERRDFDGLLERLRSDQDITLSAIAVGSTPNIPLLSTLIAAGGGTLYEAADFTRLPQISIQATQRISRQRFVTGPVGITGTLIAAAGVDAIPDVAGYVASYPRAAARVGLWAGEDPLYASWRVGLGVVGVLNTDLSGVWTANWLAWDGVVSLFGEMLAATEPLVRTSSRLTPSIQIDGAETTLWVDARETDGAYVDHLRLEADLLPDGRTFALDQVGPGMYRADLPTPAQGGHVLRIRDVETDRITTLSLVIPYPAEYAAFGPDWSVLGEIAASTGGVVLTGANALPDVAGRETVGSVSLVPPLLLVALGSFLLDLVVRKWPQRRRRR
jgi:hypothetical protein